MMKENKYGKRILLSAFSYVMLSLCMPQHGQAMEPEISDQAYINALPAITQLFEERVKEACSAYEKMDKEIDEMLDKLGPSIGHGGFISDQEANKLKNLEGKCKSRKAIVETLTGGDQAKKIKLIKTSLSKEEKIKAMIAEEQAKIKK